ncbi:MAG: hypothetical protein GY835_15545 [bacterium]|nr:hypothetical protein [bacterium]
MPDTGGAFIHFPESPLLPPETATEIFLYGLTRFGMKPGLRNMNELLERFGHPERDLRFLHVAGTNGKGSTCLFLDRLLRDAGHSTGLFTSPHILHVGERLRVSGVSLTDDELDPLVRKIESAVSELEATFFETLTLMALLHFRERNVDWVLWETGLGGRLDCTRVVDPTATLLTSIALDHTRYLGDTLEAIALEKLAIGKPGVPFHCALPEGPLLELARSEAKDKGFLLRELHKVLPWRFVNDVLQLDGVLKADLTLPGLNPVQAPNVALALATLAELEQGRSEKLLPDDLVGSLANTRLAGRCHLLRKEPLLVLDGGHNPAALTESLKYWDTLPKDNAVIVFGAMEDKEIDDLITLLGDRNDEIVFTAANQGRALPPENFLAHPAAAGKNWSTAPDLFTALKQVGEERPLLITGSFYLAAEAYHLLGVDPWA